jgi:hypothetical protein
LWRRRSEEKKKCQILSSANKEDNNVHKHNPWVNIVWLILNDPIHKRSPARANNELPHQHAMIVIGQQ